MAKQKGPASHSLAKVGVINWPARAKTESIAPANSSIAAGRTRSELMLLLLMMVTAPNRIERSRCLLFPWILLLSFL